MAVGYLCFDIFLQIFNVFSNSHTTDSPSRNNHSTYHYIDPNNHPTTNNNRNWNNTYNSTPHDWNNPHQASNWAASNHWRT